MARKQQQARYIPPMARGETLWCQGFSEPEAGSDLASLRTRADQARRRSIAINGQKIWTSYAGHADTCFLLARTSPGKGGISIFLLPMDTPGITVRQIPSIIGEGDIHEVFFDDVEVPAERAAGRGRAGLGNRAHRAVAGARRHSAFCAGVTHAASRGGSAQETRAVLVRAPWSRRRKRMRPAKWRGSTATTLSTSAASGQPPGPEASAARFATVNAERLVNEFVVEHLPDALAGGDPMLLAHHQRAHCRRHRLGRR